jgi:ATP-dependent protease HslVU (ClpYQ) peptidase subunit
MTTVVASKAGLMAADSCRSFGGQLVRVTSSKIINVKHARCLVAFAGNNRPELQRLRDELVQSELPSIRDVCQYISSAMGQRDDCEAIVCTVGELVRVAGYGATFDLADDWGAIGSGSAEALGFICGAMNYGADLDGIDRSQLAAQAVAYSCQVDANTRGPIEVTTIVDSSPTTPSPPL